MSTPFVSAASLDIGVSAEIIAVQPGISFTPMEPGKRSTAGTEVVHALFSGCGGDWATLRLGKDAEAEFEPLFRDVEPEGAVGECGRSLKLINRGRIINVESNRVTTRGKSVMSVEVHL